MNKLKVLEENEKLMKKKYSDELKEKQKQINSLNDEKEQLKLAGSSKDPNIEANFDKIKKEMELNKRTAANKEKIASDRIKELQEKIKEKDATIKQLEKL